MQQEQFRHESLRQEQETQAKAAKVILTHYLVTPESKKKSPSTDNDVPPGGSRSLKNNLSSALSEQRMHLGADANLEEVNQHQPYAPPSMYHDDSLSVTSWAFSAVLEIDREFSTLNPISWIETDGTLRACPVRQILLLIILVERI